MRMPMMDVRVVGVTVGQDLMLMVMRMRLLTTPRKGVLMLVMLVVAVGMAVLERLVRVDVFMSLSNVQPYAHAHEDRRSPKEPAGWLRP
jgi:hypothetical protein